jgi:hypothetical protein
MVSSAVNGWILTFYLHSIENIGFIHVHRSAAHRGTFCFSWMLNLHKLHWVVSIQVFGSFALFRYFCKDIVRFDWLFWCSWTFQILNILCCRKSSCGYTTHYFFYENTKKKLWIPCGNNIFSMVLFKS